MVEHYWLAVNDDRQVGQLSLLPISPRTPRALTWACFRQGVDSIHKLGYTRLQSNRTSTVHRIAARSVRRPAVLGNCRRGDSCVDSCHEI